MLFNFVAPKLPPKTNIVNTEGLRFNVVAACILVILKISFRIGLDV